MSELVLHLADAVAAEAALAGGKGASLARLAQAGFDVPAALVVTAEAYRAFARSVPELDALAGALEPDDAERLHAQCASIRELLVSQPLPPALDAALRERLPALLAGGAAAVRSSATLEDLAGAAFAGQHDTYLGVRGVDGVVDAVRRCFASLWEDRAVRYRRERGLDAAAADMAVVVQQMVASEVAGVAFSMNPITGALDQVVVNAAYGLGETVVSGEGDVDQWVLEKGSGRVVESVVAEKLHALVGDDGVGTVRVALDAARRTSPCLDHAQLAALAALALSAERFYGFPQDIEWAFAGGQLYMLQSRPVTRFPARWTRGESAERFPNPVTPLTWDFTTEGFHESLAHSLALMGMPPFDGMWFERLDGYIYGNDTAVQLFTSDHAVAFESLDALAEMVPVLRDRYRWVQELPVLWARDLDRYLLRLGRLSAADLDALDDDGLWQHLLALDALGRDYFLPNIAISITQAQLHRMLFRLVGLVVPAEQAPALYDRLTAFCETKTSLVNADLYGLYRSARAEPALMALLLDVDRRRVVEEDLLAPFPRFAQAFDRFVEDHGHREVDFDAYHATWSGQPWVVLENVRLMLLRGDVPEPAAREGELRARQQEAEREFLALVPPPLRNLAAELLRLARAYTALDDLEHYQTTRLTPPFRAAAIALGERLARRGVLDEPRDVFFLDRRALEAVVTERAEGNGEGAADEVRRGTKRAAEAAREPASGRAARAAVDAAREEALRNKQAYERQRAAEPPHVWGEDAPAPEVEGALRGLPGSPGEAEGPVCRVHGVEDFARFQPGSVLVARTTNPAWTPLFYSACAVITESGGPLSHGAVTAREAGIPAVMGLRGALERFADGERVRVDGTRGVVTAG